MVNNQHGDTAALGRAGSPDALGVHAGLHHAEIELLRPDLRGQRVEARPRLDDRKAPVHDRPDGQAVNFNAVPVNFVLRQVGQSTGNHNDAVPGGNSAAGKVPGIALHTTHRGQVLRRKITNRHRAITASMAFSNTPALTTHRQQTRVQADCLPLATWTRRGRPVSRNNGSTGRRYRPWKP